MKKWIIFCLLNLMTCQLSPEILMTTAKGRLISEKFRKKIFEIDKKIQKLELKKIDYCKKLKGEQCEIVNRITKFYSSERLQFGLIGLLTLPFSLFLEPSSKIGISEDKFYYLMTNKMIDKNKAILNNEFYETSLKKLIEISKMLNINQKKTD